MRFINHRYLGYVCTSFNPNWYKIKHVRFIKLIHKHYNQFVTNCNKYTQNQQISMIFEFISMFTISELIWCNSSYHQIDRYDLYKNQQPQSWNYCTSKQMISKIINSVTSDKWISYILSSQNHSSIYLSVYATISILKDFNDSPLTFLVTSVLTNKLVIDTTAIKFAM